MKHITQLFLLMSFCFFSSFAQACFVNNNSCEGGQNFFDLELDVNQSDSFVVQCSDQCVATVSIASDNPSLVDISPGQQIIDETPVNIDVIANSLTGTAAITVSYSCSSWSGSCGGTATVADNEFYVHEEVTDQTLNCGPDITSLFLERLKLMTQRAQALPDSEKGIFDGTMFLKRNGTNMDFVVGNLKNPSQQNVCPTTQCSGSQHTSTLTLCGKCLVSHIDNDIEYGVMGELLDVPQTVQAAGGHGWDFLQRQGLDPLASQLAYVVGNKIAEGLVDNPDMDTERFCQIVENTRIIGAQTGFSWKTAMSQWQSDLSGFGFDGCQPCVHDCPESKVLKDFSTQDWALDDGSKATPPQ